ncbi:alpha/beta fold hydrolase [Chlorogloeopsis fritschii PCC 9212]
MPTLVMWGDRDRVLPKEQAENAVKRLQHGQLALIPDCGHLPQVERPELFVAALAEFLGKVVYQN